MPHSENTRLALIDAITRYGPILAIGEAGAANVLVHLELAAGYLTASLIGVNFPTASEWSRRPISPALRAARPAEQVTEARAYLAEVTGDLQDMLSRAEAASRQNHDHLELSELVDGCRAAGLTVVTLGFED